MKQPKDMTVQEVAEELGLHIDTVRKLLRSGALAGYRPDLKQWRVTRAALDQFKASGGAKRPGRPAKGSEENQ